MGRDRAKVQTAWSMRSSISRRRILPARPITVRIIEELLTSNPVLVANRTAWQDEWKQAKIKQIAVLMRAALDADARVGLKLNVAKKNLEKIIALLPSITAPTISYLYASPR